MGIQGAMSPRKVTPVSQGDACIASWNATDRRGGTGARRGRRAFPGMAGYCTHGPYLAGGIGCGLPSTAKP